MEITREMVIRAASRLYDDEQGSTWTGGKPNLPLMTLPHVQVKIDYLRRAKAILEAALQTECFADLSV